MRKTETWKSRNNREASYLGIVTHLVLPFCVVIAFSSSSSWPVFFNFFTKLFTAFSHHFSSCPFCSPLPAPPGTLVDFFQPKSRFTTGGVNGNMEDIFNWTSQESPQDLTQAFSHTQTREDGEQHFWALALRSPSSDHWDSEWMPLLAVHTQKGWTPWERGTHKIHCYKQNKTEKQVHLSLNGIYSNVQKSQASPHFFVFPRKIGAVP